MMFNLKKKKPSRIITYHFWFSCFSQFFSSKTYIIHLQTISTIVHSSITGYLAMDSLLGLLADTSCKFLLRHIYVSSTTTKSACGLHCNCTVQFLVYSFWEIVHMVRSAVSKKASRLKPLITVTCDFMQTQPSMDSKQFFLHNFTHKVWVNLWLS